MDQPVFKHQEFSINNETRKKVIRQDRIFVESGVHKMTIGQSEFDVDNYSAFGIAIKNFNLVGDRFQGVYSVDGIQICDLHISLARVTKNDFMQVTGFVIEGMPFPVEAVNALTLVRKTISKFEENKSEFAIVPESFKTETHHFKNWIQSIEIEINQLQKTNFDLPGKTLFEYEEAICQYVSMYLMVNVQLHSQKIAAVSEGLSPEILKKCYEYLRSMVGETFYKSPYGNRAYTKPRGYAGDYEMMNNVYYNELRGQSLFGKCLQRYFTDNPAGKAVRNRAIYLNEKIKQALEGKEKIKILGVASGPAREIQKLFAEHSDIASRCEIHLLDQDADALKFSQRDILDICRDKNIRPNIHFHNLAIKNIINEGLPMSDFDLIYSAGLFDYFTDPVAQFAASKLYMGLKSGGNLIIGNFNTNNPAQFIMEAIGDWYLIYRNEKQMTELFSKITPRLKIEKEKENVNLFAVMEK
jgi:extracellular factor (EF) 3-hydroxypalmitic acid methyl ester biosynthesis protein